MPPKEDTDWELCQLRSYVASHLAQLVPSEKAILKGIFAARKRGRREEVSFYKFSLSQEATFTDAQRRYAEETLAILVPV